MLLSKIPATIVTGFLGSGKTTLLSQVLAAAKGKRLAIIVNEFGEIDIDAELIRNCPLKCESADDAEKKAGIYELANGCICCTVEEEFLPVMQQLVARKDTIDHILIETSGLALPKPLVQAFNWPEIKQYCTVDAVITVVDGPAVAAGRFAHDVAQVTAQRLADENLDHESSIQELLEDQLSAADLIIVSKNDLLDNQQRNEVAELIATKTPKAVKTLFVENGDYINEQIPLQQLLDINASTEQRIEQIKTHHDHHHDHDQEHDHAHDAFDSLVITIGEVDGEKLQAGIQTLLDRYSIYRVKGFVAIPNKPMRQVVQAVGRRIHSYFDRPWSEREERQTCLVFIGRELDRVALMTVIEQALIPCIHESVV